jgi:magnesium chelatase family protein
VPGSELCRCSQRAIERHARRLSAPFLDRIEVRVAMRAPGEARGTAPLTSERARALVAAARERQRARLAAAGLATNAELDANAIARHVRLDAPSRRMLASTAGRGALSPRGEHGTVKLARTIADLDGRERIRAEDIAQALALRFGGAEPAG